MRFRDLKKQAQKIKQTQESRPLHVEARYVDRIKAFITDMFMIYVPILYILAYAVLDGKDAFQESSAAQFIGVALYAFIYALFLSNSGQTPGKKAYTMKVVDASTYEKISFLKALWRFVAFLFSAMIGVGLLVPFFRKDNKTLHDLMAHTMVEAIAEA